MSTTTFNVTGMTCGGCVRHVSHAVSEVAGVIDVEVRLATVTSGTTVDRAAVEAAVAAAGYRVAS